jgi:hypothetical protein
MILMRWRRRRSLEGKDYRTAKKEKTSPPSHKMIANFPFSRTADRFQASPRVPNIPSGR